MLPHTITRPVARLGAAAQNALEVARFGGLATDEEPSPYELHSEQRVYRLRRYYPHHAGTAPPVLLEPPMMLAAEVYDVSPATSAVTILREHGVDPWVVDFGAPESSMPRPKRGRSAQRSRPPRPRCGACLPGTTRGWPPAICSDATATATTGAWTAPAR